MARLRYATATTALAAAVAFGLAGCGPAQVGEASKAAAVDVAAALGADGQALAAMGFDPAELEPAAAPSPSGSASPEAGAEKAGKGAERRQNRQARVLLRKNTLHGEAVVQTKDGGTRTVAVQRGQVTAISATSMTVRSTDGFTMTWAFGPDLKVVERRNTIRAADVAVGTTVGVAGAKDGDGGTARLVVVPLKQR